MPTGAHGPAQLRVQGLDGVGGVDDPQNLVGKGEERDDVGLGAPPALADGGIAGTLGVQSRHLVDRVDDEPVWL